MKSQRTNRTTCPELAGFDFADTYATKKNQKAYPEFISGSNLISNIHRYELSLNFNIEGIYQCQIKINK